MATAPATTTTKAPATTTTTTRLDPLEALKPVNGELADAAAFNADWDYDPHETDCGLPFQVFEHIGETLRGKLVLGYTGDWDPDREGINNVRTQIDSGRTIAGYQDGITWGFYDFRTKLGFNGNGEGKGYFPFTAAQRTVAAQSIAYWDDVTNIKFTRVDVSWHDARAWAKGLAPDILFANTTSGPAQAWAYYPGGSGRDVFARIGSDVWIGADGSNYFNLWDGGYGQTTQVHELGHALGLSHPGDYNFGDGVPITYVNSAVYFQDDRQYTTMSYWDSYDVGSNYIDWNLMRFMYAATPMVDDIWVLQQKYGVDNSTRTGNTVYGFNSTADVTNTAMKFVAGEQMTIFTIWDAGGEDTLDLSGYYTPSVIDLREGAYSSAGGFGAYGQYAGVDPSTLSETDYMKFVNDNNTALGMPTRTATQYDLYFTGNVQQRDATGKLLFNPDGTPLYYNEGIAWADIVARDWLMENNIGIAYGAVIENAIGGHGNDRINGNWATNYLTGKGGADTFVIFDNTGTNAVGVTRTDTRHDYITDFTTGVDKIDLCEFAGVTAANVKFEGEDLKIDTNLDGDYTDVTDFTVTLLGGATINTTTDIVYHSSM